MDSFNKICRICFNFSSTHHISKSRRSEQSFKRFCIEINYKDVAQGDEENVTICGECMPLVESVSRSKCSLEVVEDDVLKLQRRLLKMLNELEEELGSHQEGMEKLEEIVNGSSPHQEVFERINSTEIDGVMEFRKGILEVAKDLRAFRRNINGKLMASSPESRFQDIPEAAEPFIKLEVPFSPPSSPVVADEPDPLWFPEAEGDIPVPNTSREKRILRRRAHSSKASSSDSEDEPTPTKRRRGGDLEFIRGSHGKTQLIYNGFRFLRNKQRGSRARWICSERRNKCPAFIRTENTEIIEFSSNHNHTPDPEKIEKMRTINKIIEAGGANLTPATVKSIISINVEDKTALESMTRTIRRRDQKVKVNKPVKKIIFNPDDFESDLSGPVEFTKSNRGTNQLIFRGHLFNLDKTSTQRKHWTCVERRSGGCKSTINTANNEVIKYYNKHNHSTNTTLIEAKKLYNKVKDDVTLSTSNSAVIDIVSSTLADVKDDVMKKLPSIQNMARTIRNRHTKKNPALALVKKEKEIIGVIEGPFEYVKSKRGNNHLIFQGYRYSINKFRKIGSRWACALKKCPAFLFMKNGTVIRYNLDHNHPPENERYEKMRLMENLKETCLTSEDNPGDLVAEVDLGDLKVNSVKRILRRVRQLAKGPNLENVKDRIHRNNPEIFLMDEFMQEVVIAMITSEERRHLKKAKSLKQFNDDPRLNYAFRFDWNEKRIYLEDVEIAVDEKSKSVKCCQCSKLVGPAGAAFLTTQIFDHIIGKHYFAYECAVCKERLDSFKDFQGHKSSHMNPELPCDICGRPVAEGSFQRHRATHMGEEEKKKAKSERRITCTICGKSFPRIQSVRRHEKSHKGWYF